jgi:predicted transcriptional regulator
MKYHKYPACFYHGGGAWILEALETLLFELAGPDRLEILLALKNRPLRLSHLSKKLDFTVQETSRNVSRLAEAKLVVKEAYGNFRLTPYGEETLNLIDGFSFLSKHRDYFTTHTLSTLPKEFSYSLASLKGCQLVDDVMVLFSNVERMIQKAEEYIWILSNQVLVSTIPYIQEALKRGAEFKLVLPKMVAPPKDAMERMFSSVFLEAMKAGKFELRFLENVDLQICLSEKEVAALCFLNTEGKIDYHGFRTKDELSFKWAKALYSHYWNMATQQENGTVFSR